jgi:predicted nucleic acid-binding protein
MLETLVINASPLIFLGNAGKLELLRAGGATRFVVPSSVLEEVTRHADQAARSVADAGWIERAQRSQFRPRSALGTSEPASQRS